MMKFRFLSHLYSPIRLLLIVLCLNILLTSTEIKHLLEAEKDPQIKKFIQEYADYGGSSVNYIGMVLKTGYSVTLRNAFRASGQTSELMYLTSVIESEIYD